MCRGSIGEGRQKYICHLYVQIDNVLLERITGNKCLFTVLSFKLILCSFRAQV